MASLFVIEVTMVYDAIIIGGGASGFACAYAALQSAKKVLILEKNESPLRKVAVSGGGRCNFTNLSISSKNYINGSFCDKAINKFSNKDFVALMKKNKLHYVEKNGTQLFC
ncbi:MAG: NAD(P)/FAD-dependent oxidoreductase, partial [Lactobacillus sp.]|nr:NAD(P)/FAD-dependent oxidoreductase [Lactobacillus sp.]